MERRQDIELEKESNRKEDIEMDSKGIYNNREIQYAAKGEPNYPKRLLHIPSPPKGIYYIGKLPREEVPSVAMIGARVCSEYGRMVAKTFGEYLAQNGIQIISGMARGIDSIGQKGALDVGGQSFGVLGSGVDICYPKENLPLYKQLKKMGGVLSEFAPKMPPKANHFPARNRIISGLSDLVLVIEAKEKSGTFITVDMALEQGKDVAVIPGRISDPFSKGCNELLKQGAYVATSPEDILDILSFTLDRRIKPYQKIKPYQMKEKTQYLLENKENMVYSCLGFYSKNLDDISNEVSMPVSEVLSILIKLELKGYIREIAKNNYVVNTENN